MMYGKQYKTVEEYVKIRVSETIGDNNFIVKKMGDSNFMDKYVLA